MFVVDLVSLNTSIEFVEVDTVVENFLLNFSHIEIIYETLKTIIAIVVVDTVVENFLSNFTPDKMIHD